MGQAAFGIASVECALGMINADTWQSLPTMLAYLVIYALTCLTTSMLALFFSTVCKKTSTSLMITYSVIMLLYIAPLAANFFANTYYPAAPHSQRLITCRCTLMTFQSIVSNAGT